MKDMFASSGWAAKQAGVSAISGVFLMLLMAVLAAGMVNLVSTGQVNVSLDVSGIRAYQAARAGAEWGAFQLDPNAENSALPACAGGSPAVPGYNVTVTCTSNDYVEAGRTIRVFQIVSVATGAGAGGVGLERRIDVTVEKCRDSAITVAPFDC